MKHTSTVLELSISFHTLVKLVDAEDIANDKIRTYDLTLEVNSITNQLQSQNVETQQSEHIKFTQSRHPNSKHKPAFKKFCSYCHRTNHSISSLFQETPLLDLNLLKNHLYITSILLPVRITVTEQITNLQKPMIDIVCRSTSRHSNTNRNTSSQSRYRSHSRDQYSNDRTTTPPQFHRSRYDTYRRDSRSQRSPNRSSYRSPYRRNSRPRYRSRSYSRDRHFPQYTSSYRPPSQRESRPFRSISNSETENKFKTIQTQQSNSPIYFETHMYHPTEMANASTHTSWFYSLYLHTPEKYNDNDHPSRLESSFLLNSDASISILNYPTYFTIAKLLNITCNNKTNHTSKILTVANQTEVPILH